MLERGNRKEWKERGEIELIRQEKKTKNSSNMHETWADMKKCETNNNVRESNNLISLNTSNLNIYSYNTWSLNINNIQNQIKQSRVAIEPPTSNSHSLQITFFILCENL